MEDLTLAARLKLRVFSVDDDEVSMERRGFVPVDERARTQLETIALTFLAGFRAAISIADQELLARRLDETEAEFRGFAHEGAAMGLTVLDAVLPTRRRLRAFLRGPGFPYAWMAPIGFGWARAQMHRRPRRPQLLVDPLLDWFALDGAGFHDGFFHPQRFIEERRLPRGLVGTSAGVYDQGIGRSLWFVRGADVERIRATIESFPAPRQRHLWSGVASAATYAGGVDAEALAALRNGSGKHRAEVAQGAAFAIKARLAGGNPVSHTALAAEVFCGMPAIEAARCTDAALEGIVVAGHDSPYDAWRDRVKAMLSGAEPPAGAGPPRQAVAGGAAG
jgi:enediyne biosynthesis protein E3